MDRNPIPSNAQWRKSSYSGPNGGDCVEVATMPAAVAIRDSKNLNAGPFRVAPEAFTAFVAAASARPGLSGALLSSAERAGRAARARAVLREWSGYAPTRAEEATIDAELDRRLSRAGAA